MVKYKHNLQYPLHIKAGKGKVRHSEGKNNFYIKYVLTRHWYKLTLSMNWDVICLMKEKKI
jgi:hypothetical protein